MSAVTLDNVSKSFGAFEVIKNILLEIPEGEFCVLIGPSGSGKSTLLRLLSGLDRPSSGRIFMGGRDVTGLPAKQRDIAMVFQSYALYPQMTVRENMSFALRLAKRPRAEIDEKVREAARMLGLEDYLDRLPKELSGGQRQRVAMGRAVVRNPSIFLFDEPLSNLDAKLRAQVRGEIRDLHRRFGTTSVYVTHDQVEAMTMGEKIVVLREGAIEQAGTPVELYDRPDTVFVAGFIGSPSINMIPGTIDGADGGRVRLDEQTSLPFPTGPGERGRDVLVGMRPEYLDLAAPDTEDAVAATVHAVEITGSDTTIICDTAFGEMSLVSKERSQLSAGDKIGLKPRPEHILLFDRKTERRLDFGGSSS